MTEIIDGQCPTCGADFAIEVPNLDDVPEAPVCEKCGEYLWKGIAVDVRIACQEPGCTNEPVMVRCPDGTPDWYCETHMALHGFCTECDEYWGDVSGICPDCRLEVAIGDDEEDTAEIETIILDEAEAAKRRLLLHVPEYIEVYRRITFHEQGVRVEHLNEEDEDSEWAEVNIPLHEDGTVYCVVCYIVGRPAHQPAVLAMMLLNPIARELVHGLPGIIKLEGK